MARRRWARSVGEAETEAGFAVVGGDLGDHVLEPAGDVGVDLLGGEGEELCVAFDLAADVEAAADDVDVAAVDEGARFFE